VPHLGRSPPESRTACEPEGRGRIDRGWRDRPGSPDERRCLEVTGRLPSTDEVQRRRIDGFGRGRRSVESTIPSPDADGWQMPLDPTCSIADERVSRPPTSPRHGSRCGRAVGARVARARSSGGDRARRVDPPAQDLDPGVSSCRRAVRGSPRYGSRHRVDDVRRATGDDERGHGVLGSPGRRRGAREAPQSSLRESPRQRRVHAHRRPPPRRSPCGGRPRVRRRRRDLSQVIPSPTGDSRARRRESEPAVWSRATENTAPPRTAGGFEVPVAPRRCAEAGGRCRWRGGGD